MRVGVIPAAGFSTGLYPASKVVQPELFPIIDQDGVTKPAILVNVEELLRSGIERVVIVCQPEDIPLFERLFQQPDTPQNFHRLSEEGQAYARTITSIGDKVTLVAQERQEGFGHALHCCRDAVGNEPFVLLIGKHIYRSNTAVTCVKQLIDKYDKHGSSIMGLKRTAAEHVSAFGTVAGKWEVPGGDDTAVEPSTNAVLRVTEMHEKHCTVILLDREVHPQRRRRQR